MKTITDYPNYAVTKDGKVWNKRHKRFLRSAMSTYGYPSVCLRENGKQKFCKIHQLVLNAFVGPCPGGMECRHLDGNAANNNLDNLCWSTPKENQRDRVKHGTSNRGEQHGMAKLTESKVILIRMLYAAKWLQFRQWELAKLFNVTRPLISGIIKRKAWKHI